MNIDTSAWGWPQWAMLILLFLGFAIRASLHGKPMIDKETKEPEKYNGFVGAGRFALMLFILTAGGFFA